MTEDYDALEQTTLEYLEEKLKGRRYCWFTGKSLSKKLKIRPLVFSKVLTKLIAKGRITREGRGLYIFYSHPQEEHHE